MSNILTVADQQELNNLFTHHAPKGDQIGRYQAIREAGKLMATTIMLNCPPSEDRDSAVRKIRESVMMANASIAINE